MYIEVHDLSSVFTKSVCTAQRDQCSWLLLTWHKSSRRTRYSNFFVCIRLKRYSHVTRNTKRKDVISFLWYIHAIAICERERERESQGKQSAGRTASTTQTFAKYSINTAKVCVCLLTFFCLLSAEKLLTGDEKRRKKHVDSSLWYTEALQFVRVHACITLKRKCRTNSKHDTQNLWA